MPAPAKGLVCPVCRYPNSHGLAASGRCLRCGAPLLTPLACNGACSKCAVSAECTTGALVKAHRL